MVSCSQLRAISTWIFTIFAAKHQKAAFSAGEADDVVHHDLQQLINFERGIDHLADLGQGAQTAPLVFQRLDLLLQGGQFTRHPFDRGINTFRQKCRTVLVQVILNFLEYFCDANQLLVDGYQR